MTIAHSVLALWIGISYSLAGTINLETRVNLVSLPKWGYPQLIAFLGSRAGYTVEIDPNALDQASTNRHGQIGFDGRFDDISVRDALSWTLHYANVSVRIGDSTLNIDPMNGSPVLPEALSLSNEAQVNLPPRTASITLKDSDWDLRQLLAYLTHKMDLKNVVIDPSIAASNINVRVSFENIPATEALHMALEMAGAESFIYGEVIYLRLKQ